ncbi:MAG TPA: acyltransferase [Longimicrobium sp.]|nr:acyltransferase [Longimicrobium sp.]
MEERASPKGGSLYLPTFDGVRGFVVIAIVCAHLRLLADYVPNHDVPLWLSRGMFFSVDLLFVISAFVLFLPMAARGEVGSKRAFALKRIGRIVPNYYVSLVVAVLIMTFTTLGPAANLPAPSAKDVVLHMLFIHLETATYIGLGVHAVVWALSIIVIFYLLVPFVALAFRRHPFRWIAGALVISALWRAGVDQGDRRLYVEFPLFLDDFAIGMGAALAYIELRRRNLAERLRRLSLPVVAVAGLALATCVCLGGRQLQLGQVIHQGEAVPISIGVALSFATLVVASAFLPAWAQWPLANRFSRWLGEVSYGVFLYHVFIGYAVADALDLGGVGNAQGFLLLVVTVVPLSLLVSWVSYVTVERPLRERMRRFAKRYERPREKAEMPAVGAEA